MEFRRYFLFIMTLLVGFSECQLEDMAQIFGTKKYCGERLSAALSDICKGNYNTLRKKPENYQKKSYWNPHYRRLEIRDVSHVTHYPFKDKAEATAMISNFRRRRKRGVYNECCEKPCSRDELFSYCAAPQSSSKKRR